MSDVPFNAGDPGLARIAFGLACLTATVPGGAWASLTFVAGVVLLVSGMDARYGRRGAA